MSMPPLSTPPCAHCASDFCIFIIPECQHAFHTRCVAQWPIQACPVCHVPTAGVKVLPSLIKDQHSSSRKTRTGKWSTEEQEYAQALLQSFLHGHLFCANGTSVRTVLSKSLNCSPMRLSKKFQKRPLGKHSFRLPESRKIDIGEAHLAQQKILSSLELAFYQSVLTCDVNQAKTTSTKGKSQVGDEILALIQASRTFWIEQFLAFAAYLGQSVIGYDFHLLPLKPRKRKRTKRSDTPRQDSSSMLSHPWIHQPPPREISPGLSHSSSSSSFSDDHDETPELSYSRCQLPKVSVLDTFEFNPDWMFHHHHGPNMMQLNQYHPQIVTHQPLDDTFLLPKSRSSEEDYFTDSTASVSGSPVYHYSYPLPPRSPEILGLDLSDFALSPTSRAPSFPLIESSKWWANDSTSAV